MLNGDAHHSLVWEAEPRIWPLLNCQRRCNPKRQGTTSKQKNSFLDHFASGLVSDGGKITHLPVRKQLYLVGARRGPFWKAAALA
jgi:hypothetical protein